MNDMTDLYDDSRICMNDMTDLYDDSRICMRVHDLYECWFYGVQLVRFSVVGTINQGKHSSYNRAVRYLLEKKMSTLEHDRLCIRETQ